MQKYIPRFEKSRKSHWWLAKTHSCNRSGSSRPTSSSRLASAGWEVEPIHPPSFTAKASENYSPFGMVNVHGARAGCFESFPENKYISNFGMTSRLITLVVNLMYGFWCKKYSLEAGVKLFFEQPWVKGCGNGANNSNEIMMNYPCDFRHGNPSLWFGSNGF